ncbi:MAG: leucine-rich repeat protein [Bacteroidales bacterium]|nr:leucine-rich repeat protein [Candidatus Colicola faecequi]
MRKFIASVFYLFIGVNVWALTGSCGPNLTFTYVNGGNKITIQGTGRMYDYSSQQAVPWGAYAARITNIILSEGITHIGNYAFTGSSITSISLPESVTSIGSHAFTFSQYSYSWQLNLPSALDTIGAYAFVNYGSYTAIELELPTTLKYIGDHAFTDAIFQYVNIPSSVEYIGQNPFKRVNSLAVDSQNRYYDSREDCNAIIHTASNTLIKASAFCSFIPRSVKVIGAEAISGSNQLIIPETIDTISSSALCGSGVLIFEGTTPPVISEDAVSYMGSYTKFIVPCGSLNAYSSVSALSNSHYTDDRYQQHSTSIEEISAQASASFDFTVDNPIHGYVDVDSALCNLYLHAQAIPDTCYQFLYWENNTSNQQELGNPISFVRIKDGGNYTAHFEKVRSRITSEINHGTVEGSGIYEIGAEVSLMATASPHYHFTQWADGNTDNPRRIVVSTADENFVAIAEIDRHSVSASANNGAVFGGGEYAYGETISLLVTADYGYHFYGWSDGNSENPRMVNVVHDTVFNAVCTKEEYSIATMSSSEGGSTIGDTIVKYQESVEIAAQPIYGYHFTQWSDGNTDNPRIIEVTCDSTFTALFERNSYQITTAINNEEWGSAYGDTLVHYREQIVISAVPSTGYYFTQWSDGNTNNPRAVEVTSDSVFTAQFAKLQFFITVTSSDTNMGSVTGSAKMDYMSPAVILAVPAEGHHFEQWNDGITDNPRAIIVVQDTAFEAEFAINQYKLTLSVNDDDMGIVSGAGIYDYRSMVECQALPVSGYEFVKWSDGSTFNPYSFIIKGDTSLTAEFRKIQSALDDVETESNVQKIFRDGHFYIQTSDGLFTIDGRKVE